MDFAFPRCHVLSSLPFQRIFPLCTGVMWGCRATRVQKFQSASLSCIHTMMPQYRHECLLAIRKAHPAVFRFRARQTQLWRCKQQTITKAPRHYPTGKVPWDEGKGMESARKHRMSPYQVVSRIWNWVYRRYLAKPGAEREALWAHFARQTQRNRKTMKNLQIVLTCPNHDCSSDTSTMKCLSHLHPFAVQASPTCSGALKYW